MNPDFYKPQVLECPYCGATLALPDADTFECDYCGKRIQVPAELRPVKPDKQAGDYGAAGVGQQVSQAESIHSPATEQDVFRQRRRSFILILGISIALLLLGLVAFLVALISVSSSTSSDNPPVVELRTTPLPTLVQFARLVQVFGTEGDQAGQFDDPRSIAIDAQGNIFVADYSSGRINEFDADGNFLQLIKLQPTNGSDHVYIFNIDADELGNLYVAASGNILKYAAATGELLATFPDRWPEIYYESVRVGPDGNIYTTNGMAGADDLIILSPQGELLQRWKGIIGSVNPDDPRMELILGVNHSGFVYLLSPFASQVYGYNPDGSYNASFGEEGDRTGQFSLSTDSLVVTNQDYLIIAEAYRVDLFDSHGSYLAKSFSIDYQVAGGGIRDMALDDQEDLYFITSGGKVLKFDMNYP